MGKQADGKPARRQDYETPRRVMDAVAKRVGLSFVLDVASTVENSRCKYRVEDGLSLTPWSTQHKSRSTRAAAWCNPPYGRGMMDWMQACFRNSASMHVVALVPANATDTAWCKYALTKADEFYLVSPRIRFELEGVPQTSPSFGSMVIGFYLLTTSPKPVKFGGYIEWQ